MICFKTLIKIRSSGDNSIDSACREVEEELGIHIEPSQLKFICSVKNDLVLNNGTYIDREIADIYVVEMDIDDNEFKLQGLIILL